METHLSPQRINPDWLSFFLKIYLDSFSIQIKAIQF